MAVCKATRRAANLQDIDLRRHMSTLANAVTNHPGAYGQSPAISGKILEKVKPRNEKDVDLRLTFAAIYRSLRPVLSKGHRNDP